MYKLYDCVETPRFLKVKILATFATEDLARECGFTEPTDYNKEYCKILGKHVGLNRMVFASVDTRPEHHKSE
jgi:hypothetical protein